MSKTVYLFGYGKQGYTLAEELRVEGFDVIVIETEERYVNRAKEAGIEKVYHIDVTEDSQIEALQIEENATIVCVMEDEHLNVFLTLSLRALYPKSVIFAISSSIHVTQKLKMAGASRVIDLYHVSANRIHNILSKPVATKLLDSFITHDSDISIREITIPEGSFLHGKMAEEVDFSAYGVLLLGLVDIELGSKFIFITSGVEHKLDAGDILVCIGYNEDLDRFEQRIKQSEVEK
jgi:voltage-gated potassium channel